MKPEKKRTLFICGAAIVLCILLFGFSTSSPEGVREKRAENDILSTLSTHSATLARVLNAISLQNELLSGSITMKDVIAELFGVSDSKLFDTLNEKNIEDVTAGMSILNGIIVAPPNGINASIQQLKVLTEPVTVSTPTDNLTVLFQNLADPTSVLSKPLETSEIEVSGTNAKKILDELKKPSPVFSTIDNALSGTTSGLKLFESTQLPRLQALLTNVGGVIKTMDGIAAYVAVMEKYRQLVDSTVMNTVRSHLDALTTPAGKLKAWLAKDSEAVKKDLVLIHKLLSPQPPQLLIGFPEGAKDFARLAGDFNDKWLMKVLHSGASLDRLRTLLEAVLGLENAVRKVDGVWDKSVLDVRKYLEIIDDVESMKSVANALSNVQVKISNPPTIFSFHPITFQTMRNISATELQEFHADLQNLVNYAVEQQLSYSTWLSYQSSFTSLPTESAKLQSLKTNAVPLKFLPVMKNISEGVEALKGKRASVVSLVNRMLSHVSTIDDAMLETARGAMAGPQSAQQDVQKLEKFVTMLLTKRRRKRDSFDALKTMLLDGKARVADAEKIDVEFKKKAGGSESPLIKFRDSREATKQLAYSQRALDFYKSPEAVIAIQKFIDNGEELVASNITLPKEWSKFGAVKSSLLTLSTAIPSLSSKIPQKSETLTAFGKQLAVLDELSVEVGLWEMKTSLQNMPSSTSSASSESLAVQESLRELEGLQFASMRRKGAIESSMEKADAFFVEMFKEEETDITMIGVVVIVIAVILLIAGVVYLVLRKKEQNQQKTSKSSTPKKTNEPKLITQPLLQKESKNRRAPEHPQAKKPSAIQKVDEEKKKKKRVNTETTEEEEPEVKKELKKPPKKVKNGDAPWEFSEDGVLRGEDAQLYMKTMNEKDRASVEGKLGRMHRKIDRHTSHPLVVDDGGKDWKPTLEFETEPDEEPERLAGGADKEEVKKEEQKAEEPPPADAPKVEEPKQTEPLKTEPPKPPEPQPPEPQPAHPQPSEPQPLEPKPSEPQPTEPPKPEEQIPESLKKLVEPEEEVYMGPKTQIPPGLVELLLKEHEEEVKKNPRVVFAEQAHYRSDDEVEQKTPPRRPSTKFSHKKWHKPGDPIYRPKRLEPPEMWSDNEVPHPERADKVWIPYAREEPDYDRYASDDLRSIDTNTLSTQSDSTGPIFDDSTQLSLFSSIGSLSDLDELMAPDEMNYQFRHLKRAHVVRRVKRRCKLPKTAGVHQMVLRKRIKKKGKPIQLVEVQQSAPRSEYSESDDENLLLKVARTAPTIYHRRMLVDEELDEGMNLMESHLSDDSIFQRRMHVQETAMADYQERFQKKFAAQLAGIEEDKKLEEENARKGREEREKFEAAMAPYMGYILREREKAQRHDTLHKANQELQQERYEAEKKLRTPLQSVEKYLKESFEPDPFEERRIVEAAYRSVFPIDNYILARKQDRWEFLYRTEAAEFTHDWCRVRMSHDYLYECDFYDASWMFPYNDVFERVMDKYTNKLIAACSPAFQESVPVLWHWLWENDVQFLIMLNTYEECKLYRCLHWFPTKVGQRYKFKRNKLREYHITCVKSEVVMAKKGTERQFIFELIVGGRRMPPKTFTILRMRSWPKHQMPWVWEPYADLAERLKKESEVRPAVVMSTLGSGRACTLIMALQAALLVPLDDDVGVHNMVSGARECKRIACTDEGQSYVWRMVHYELLFRWFPTMAEKYNKGIENRNAVYFQYAQEFNNNSYADLHKWLFRSMSNVQLGRMVHYEFYVDYVTWWNAERLMKRWLDKKQPRIVPPVPIDKNAEPNRARRPMRPRRRKPRRIGDPPRSTANTHHRLANVVKKVDIDGNPLPKRVIQKKGQKKIKVKKEKEKKTKKTNKMKKMKNSKNPKKSKKKSKKSKKEKSKPYRAYWRMYPHGSSRKYWHSLAAERQWLHLYFQRDFPLLPVRGSRFQLHDGALAWIRRKHRPFVRSLKGNTQLLPRVKLTRGISKYVPLCRRIQQQQKALAIWRKKKKKV